MKKVIKPIHRKILCRRKIKNHCFLTSTGGDFSKAPSLVSTYLPMPKCQPILGIIIDRPSRTVAHIIGVQLLTFQRSSPSAQSVTAIWAKSPINKGVKRPQRILSCRAGCVRRYLRAIERTKTLTSPRRAQTCASWIIETSVAFGRVVGSVLFGQGAWRLCVCKSGCQDALFQKGVNDSYRYRITVKRFKVI
jgi:hypothetical protein